MGIKPKHGVSGLGIGDGLVSLITAVDCNTYWRDGVNEEETQQRCDYCGRKNDSEAELCKSCGAVL